MLVARSGPDFGAVPGWVSRRTITDGVWPSPTTHGVDGCRFNRRRPAQAPGGDPQGATGGAQSGRPPPL